MYESDLKISPNFFLYTSYMNSLDNGFEFPSNLSENHESNTSLDNYWLSSVLKPIAFSINGDTVIKDNFDKDEKSDKDNPSQKESGEDDDKPDEEKGSTLPNGNIQPIW